MKHNPRSKNRFEMELRIFYVIILGPADTTDMAGQIERHSCHHQIPVLTSETIRLDVPTRQDWEQEMY